MKYALMLFGALTGAILLFTLPMFAISALAQTVAPDGVEVFTIPSGQTCVLWPDGSGDCYCPCEGGPCAQETIVPATTSYVVPTPRVETTPTPSATSEASPTVGPTLGPTPEPTAKVKCNSGQGNGNEGCDPGRNPTQSNPQEPD